MGIKHYAVRQAQKMGDRIAKLSSLSPGQIEEIQKKQEEYFEELSEINPDGTIARASTESLLATIGVEIFNAYLPLLSEWYLPVGKDVEYEKYKTGFRVKKNVRCIEITKWVIDKEENSLEKLINVYSVLSNKDCNIALIYRRTYEGTKVYLAVADNNNNDSHTEADNYMLSLAEAIRGNFPGTEFCYAKEMDPTKWRDAPDCLDKNKSYTVASVSNVPTEKSEKFISQTIEKLLDGIIPGLKQDQKQEQEYTIILLATPILDVEERKLHLGELYSSLAPFASWQTNFTYTESEGVNSMASLGVNVGANVGVQKAQNQNSTNTQGVTDSRNEGQSLTEGDTVSESTGGSETDSTAKTISDANAETVNSSVTNSENSSRSTSSGGSTLHTDSSGKSDMVGASVNASQSVGVNASVSNSASVNVNAPFGIAGGSVGTQVTAGVSAQTTIGAGANYGHTWNSGTSDAVGSTWANTEASTLGKSTMEGVSSSQSHSVSDMASSAVAKSWQKAVAKNTAKAITKTLGRAVSNTVAKTDGISRAVNIGSNFGVNFARSSNVTATVGKNEGITQNYKNYNICHALELLEEQMKRYEQSSALGMWDFAAYILSEDYNTANNVAHSYLALTRGEKSFMSASSINIWRGDRGEDDLESGIAKEICEYLRQLRHPSFGINEMMLDKNPDFCIYPTLVTATTALTGKELAYALNFPKKSVAGFPVLECTGFGRNIMTYDIPDTQDELDTQDKQESKLNMGNIFHMNREEERIPVKLSVNSLASHVFVTGSTGAGKSNAIYQILEEARKYGNKFLVIEPAKGEYKHIFGNDPDVNVYGTNPKIMPLLRINPFSFPKSIHVLEHLDRLVEIFNVCWPMYAAMPAVLKNAVEKSYIDCGWDLTNSVNEYAEDFYPSFADVARNIKLIIDSSEYDSENKGAYKGSLLTRLNSLTNGINGMLFTRDEISETKLFDENVIIDLSRVGSSETKSLIMGMLVLKLQEYRMDQGGMNLPLRHITVLEEAHHLLKRTSSEQLTEGGNLLGKSVEMISNAIAEMRTYGEGFLIADQAPGLLDMSVIRNTNTKIILRIPEQSDREIVGRAANLNENQIQELSKLPRGVAAIYQNEWVQPVLCKIKKYTSSNGPYSYRPERELPMDYSEVCLTVTKYLSEGTKIGREVLLNDYRPKLKQMKIDDSIQCMIFRMLENPCKEPRMTKLAPIMSALFPKVYASVEQAFAETHEIGEWTMAAENALFSVIKQNENISEQMKRDIIQAIITNCLYLKHGRIDILEEWSHKGGLK